MSFFVVVVEADGPIPGEYSMTKIGVVVVEPSLSKTFLGKLKPISDKWVPKSLAVSGDTREDVLKFDDPKEVMINLNEWVKKVSVGRPVFISDNPCFDWMFSCYYFHQFCGENPFGFSGRRIGDLYCGMANNAYARWKHLRKTKHDHNPVNDALGNAEALLKMKEMGLKINLT